MVDQWIYFTMGRIFAALLGRLDGAFGFRHWRSNGNTYQAANCRDKAGAARFQSSASYDSSDKLCTAHTAVIHDGYFCHDRLLISDEKGGWSRNYFLNFTTSRIIVTKKSFLTKFADLGYVAGLAPYPYRVLLKDSNSSNIKTRATSSPEELLERESFYIWYSDISEFVLRKGIETLVANMFGRAIVSNFLHIKTSSGKEYNFTLPVNKNGTYEQIRFWIGVVLPSFCSPY